MGTIAVGCCDARSAPPLHHRIVHLWVADLDDCAAHAREVLASSDELERAERSLRTREARLRLRARGILRELLALYGGVDPGAIRLCTDPGGPPVLLVTERARGLQPHEIDFSVSHSGSLALFAFARESAIGVDIETSRRWIDAPRIVERAFGAAHAERVRALPADQQVQQCLRLWTLHEARAKCAGTGMWSSQDASATSAPEPWLTELVLPPSSVAVRSSAPVTVALAATVPHDVCFLHWNARCTTAAPCYGSEAFALDSLPT